ncbi:MAG: GNAT family N-acetyltransferase [Saccharothrix sp.]|nr:GNAT family N-acetyltransferase [Saccharothrix sp.]
MTDTTPTIATHGPEGAHALREPLLAVYTAGYAPHMANPMRTAERHWSRVAEYTTRPGFRLATVHLADELVGYTYGHTLPRGTRWWDGLLTPPDDPDLLVEDGRRTFAWLDLAVLPRCQGRGYAHLLRDALLTDRPESRAALVVESGNVKLHAMYRAWGWIPVGDLRPAPDSPTYHAMLHDLPLRQVVGDGNRRATRSRDASARFRSGSASDVTHPAVVAPVDDLVPMHGGTAPASSR